MRIAIFGMGYVGCVSAACFAKLGHDVIGVDISKKKLDLISSGQSPIIEPGLDDLVQAGVSSGKLKVSDDPVSAVENSDISMICVGTPSRANGSLDTQFLDRVMEQIGAAIANINHYHVVAVRSTLLPGFARTRLIPLLENASRKKAGEDFGVCVNPEFLRESTAIKDFEQPPFTLIGGFDERSGQTLAEAYAPLNRPVHFTQPDAASMVKYASNTWHALKVAFGNEIGAICNKLEIDSLDVMRIFAEDKSLNISKAYLRPGFAFGGSCLPKDVRALRYTAKHRDLDAPVLDAIIPSNDVHIQRAVDVVLRHPKGKVALLGLSFKKNTDDLRESPLVRIAEQLIGKGYDLSVFDKEVRESNLHGRNKEYIDHVLPHIGQMLQDDLTEVLRDAKVVIIGKKQDPAEEACLREMLQPEQTVLDLEYVKKWAPANSETIV